MAKKGYPILNDIRKRQSLVIKVYKNSECEKCGEFTKPVKLKDGAIICEKCFRSAL
jgi:formylmethanofuran dehydrogenase subunit E